MSLRVLGGSLRGRPLQSPKGDQTRPTTSMLRKAVFDILQPSIADAKFLDLFAGSGAIGIEALSRGAAHSTFVESHKEAFKCLLHNLSSLKLESLSTVYSYDVFDVLKKLEKKGETFDIIYADPPYDKKSFYTELLTFLDSSHLLKDGLLFLESRSPLEEIPLTHLISLDQRRFGTSLLHQFRKIAH